MTTGPDRLPCDTDGNHLFVGALLPRCMWCGKPDDRELDAVHRHTKMTPVIDPATVVSLSPRIPDPVSTPAVYADDTLRGRIQEARDDAYRNAQADTGSKYWEGWAEALEHVLELMKEEQ